MEDVTLLQKIREIAENGRSAIISDAEAEAVRIIEAAETSGEEDIRLARERIDLEIERLREQKLNAIRYRLNVKRYDFKARAVAAVWSDVSAKIRDIAASDDFTAVLKQLVMECVDDVPDDAVLHVPPGKAEALKPFLADQSFSHQIVESSEVIDGVEFHWPGKTVVLRNTLNDRLARLKTDSGEKIASLLFKGAEDNAE